MAKHSTNRKIAQENELSQRKPKQPESREERTAVRPDSTTMRPSPRAVVATMVSPWWRLALDRLYWAYWASFATSLDLVWLQLHAFLLILGSTHANLQSKLKKTKTKRYRRNICINRKIMQINPKIESKSIKNTYAYMTLITLPPSLLSVSSLLFVSRAF